MAAKWIHEKIISNVFIYILQRNTIQDPSSHFYSAGQSCSYHMLWKCWEKCPAPSSSNRSWVHGQQVGIEFLFKTVYLLDSEPFSRSTSYSTVYAIFLVPCLFLPTFIIVWVFKILFLLFGVHVSCLIVLFGCMTAKPGLRRCSHFLD